MKNFNFKVFFIILLIAVLVFFGPKLIPDVRESFNRENPAGTAQNDSSDQQETQTQYPSIDESSETESEANTNTVADTGDNLDTSEESDIADSLTTEKKDETFDETDASEDTSNSSVDHEDNDVEVIIEVPKGKYAITVAEAMLEQETTETESTTYHENILDLSTMAMRVNLADIAEDPELKEVLNHLYRYQYNFTPNVIGRTFAADSIYALCNKLNQLPSDYAPADLVIPDLPATTDQDVDKRYVRQVVSDALVGLFDAAKAEGYQLYCLSGYRSYSTQDIVYNNFVNKKGREDADKISARPSHSEHQSGLAMDVTTEGVGFTLTQKLGATDEGKFIAEHAHEYGLTVRYFDGNYNITGYTYEPWHLRYVGIPFATYLYENNLTLEEFYYAVQQQMHLVVEP